MRSFIAPVALLAFVVVLSGCGDVGKAPLAITAQAIVLTQVEGETLAIDTAQSKIQWRGANVRQAHVGSFKAYDGSVTVDDGKVTGVEVNIDVKSMQTENPRLTAHLLSDDFFKSAANPTASFKADRIVAGGTDGATHTVTGNLTMAGQTNSVTFPATIHVEEGKAHATADFIINRKNWGINYAGQPDNLISDDVRIMLDVVAVQAK